MQGLPAEVAQAVQPLFAALPLDQALGSLRPHDGGRTEAAQLASAAIRELPGRRHIAAGILLYVDELEASHRISQNLDDATGALWHGIMHRLEGDCANARYWFRRMGEHPAFVGHDPIEFTFAVERAARMNDPDLIARQRHEWQLAFRWCVENGL